VVRFNESKSDCDRSKIPPSYGIFPRSISVCSPRGLEALLTMTLAPAIKYAFIRSHCFSTVLLFSSNENKRLGVLGWALIPIIATVTPALWQARLAHLNEV